MTGATAAYSVHAGDVIPCPACDSRNQQDSNFCRSCGHPLPLSQFLDGAYGPLNNGPGTVVSSSGRRPGMHFDTSPEGRRRQIDGDDGPMPLDPIGDLAAAERMQAITQEDEDNAADALRAALVDAAPSTNIPEEMRFARGLTLGEAAQDMMTIASRRALSPDARHRFVQIMNTADRWRAAVEANSVAKAAVSRCLEYYETISRPDMGLPPGPGRDDADADWNGLSSRDRNRY